MSEPPPAAAASLGELLARLRAQAGLTQDELEAASGVSVRTIGNLEHDRVRRPRRRSIELLAGGLDLDPAQAKTLVAIARSAAASRTGVSRPSAATAPDGMAAGPGPSELRSGLLPRQLPAAPRYFVGRSDALTSLNRWLDNAAGPGATVVISAIGGTAGVGKTALALVWGHQVAERFPDGQLYVNLRGFDPGGMRAMTAGGALRGFVAALQTPASQAPADTQEQAALYRSLLAGKRMLIVLDNASDAEQVRPLIPASPGCAVVVTSRNQLSGLAVTDGAHQLNLDVLSAAEARHLLECRLGRVRVAAEQDAADELIRLCARLPLALGIAAAYAQRTPGLPLATLAGQLRDAGTRLDLFDSGDPVSNLRAVLGCSYTKLPGAVAHMFGLLGLHAGPDISIPAAASLAGVDCRQARRWLSHLAEANMLAEHVTDRYAFHDLIRVYAREQAAIIMTEAQRKAAVRRLLDHYLHTAHAAALLLRPSRGAFAAPTPSVPGVMIEPLTDHQQAAAWFEAEHHVLLATVTQAADTGMDVYAWQLPWAMSDFLDWRGYWREMAATQRIAAAAAARMGEAAAEAEARRLLARPCARLADYDEARTHLTACLQLYRQLGDLAGEARTHQSLSWANERQGRIDAALGHAEQALKLFQATGHKAGQARSLNNIGYCHAQLGSYLEARSSCQQALELWRDVGDQAGEGPTWDSLGFAEHHLGRLAQAAECYDHALKVLRECGDRYHEAGTLSHLGDTYHAAEDLASAGRAWQQALEIFEDLNHADAAQLRAKLAKLGYLGRKERQT